MTNLVLSLVLVLVGVASATEKCSFTAYANMHSYGGKQFVGAKGVKECQAACVKDTDCGAFDYNDNNKECWTHQSGSARYSDEGVTQYVKECVQENVIPLSTEKCTFTSYTDLHKDGGKQFLGVKGVKECEAACVNDTNCGAFDYKEKSKECWTHKSGTPRYYDKGVTQYVKKCGQDKVVSSEIVGSYGGTGGGANCVFPFIYRGKTYDKCTEANWDDDAFNGYWCATVSDYNTMGEKWGYCTNVKYDLAFIIQAYTQAELNEAVKGILAGVKGYQISKEYTRIILIPYGSEVESKVYTSYDDLKGAASDPLFTSVIGKSLDVDAGFDYLKESMSTLRRKNVQFSVVSIGSSSLDLSGDEAVNFQVTLQKLVKKYDVHPSFVAVGKVNQHILKQYVFKQYYVPETTYSDIKKGIKDLCTNLLQYTASCPLDSVYLPGGHCKVPPLPKKIPKSSCSCSKVSAIQARIAKDTLALSMCKNRK